MAHDLRSRLRCFGINGRYLPLGEDRIGGLRGTQFQRCHLDDRPRPVPGETELTGFRSAARPGLARIAWAVLAKGENYHWPAKFCANEAL